MGRYWGAGDSLGAVIMACVICGIQLGWGSHGCGLVCSTSSGFSSGCCSQLGFLASCFHCANVSEPMMSQNVGKEIPLHAAQ